MLKFCLILSFIISVSSNIELHQTNSKKVLQKIFKNHGLRLRRETNNCMDANGRPISSQPFEKPGDCDNYYQCSNGALLTRPCGPGTAFNPTLLVCDWPYNVPGCDGSNPQPTTTTSTTTTTMIDSLCVDDNGNIKSDARFEKPGNCSYYYQCVNGYLNLLACQLSTVFNPESRVCDDSENVPQCNDENDNINTTTQIISTTTSKSSLVINNCMDGNNRPISSEPFEKPGDCDNYYQCSNGALLTRPCGPGTAFNPAFLVCDWPYNVPGCDGSNAQTTITTTTTMIDPQCIDDNGNIKTGFLFEMPGNCSYYYQCVNGYLNLLACELSTVFNPESRMCDDPENVPQCNVDDENIHTTTQILSTTTSKSPLVTNNCMDANGRPISSQPFEKPGDCDNYYQCSNGALLTRPCGPGTAFNPTLLVCDWPYNVPGCDESNTQTTATTTTTTTTAMIDPECVDDKGNVEIDFRFEKPGNCSYYYQCVNGYLNLLACELSTVFNPESRVCDDPENVPQCNVDDDNINTTTQIISTTTSKSPLVTNNCMDANGRPISSQPFEKPGDCDNYYQCSNGALLTRPCGPGTAFNPTLLVCDWPYNVPGCDGSNPQPTTTTTTTTLIIDPQCVGDNGIIKTDLHFEKPGNCSYYYQCVNGHLNLLACELSTVFNPESRVCDDPENVPQCNVDDDNIHTTTQIISTTTSKSSLITNNCMDANGRPISSQPFEKPGDCDNYYQCSNGALLTRPCGPGTAFNPTFLVCDWPYNVQGCDGSNLQTTTTTTTTTSIMNLATLEVSSKTTERTIQTTTTSTTAADLNVSTLEGTACGSIITNNTILRLPVDPVTQLYENNFDCIWALDSKGGDTNITFVEQFDIEEAVENECPDYVAVYVSGIQTYGNFCGNIYPDDIIILSNSSSTIEILFHSDSNRSYQGFSIDVSFSSGSTTQCCQNKKLFLIVIAFQLLLSLF